MSLDTTNLYNYWPSPCHQDTTTLWLMMSVCLSLFVLHSFILGGSGIEVSEHILLWGLIHVLIKSLTPLGSFVISPLSPVNGCLAFSTSYMLSFGLTSPSSSSCGRPILSSTTSTCTAITPMVCFDKLIGHMHEFLTCICVWLLTQSYWCRSDSFVTLCWCMPPNSDNKIWFKLSVSCQNV